MTVKRATNKGAPGPVEAFKTHGADFVVRDNLADLVAGMNALSGDERLNRGTCASRSRPATARSPILTPRTIR